METEDELQQIAADLSGAIALPGRIQAEAFGEGGAGVSYYDTTPGNIGKAYRSTDVDLEASTDVGGGYDVGWIEAGEWLGFTVNAAKAGTFRFTARVASNYAGTKGLHLEIDGAALPAAEFTDASGWQSWHDLVVGQKTLTAGTHALRIVADTRKFNLNYVDAAQLCTATTCAAAGKNCGSISDGCGGTLSCGT
jgi:hypothetical protein